jgi:cell division protein FtsQ
VQQGAPVSGRGLPGMPVEMEDPDGDDSFGARKARFGAPRRPWWRPAGTFGRALLAFCALTAVIAVAVAFAFARSFFEHDTRFRIEGTSNIQATGLGEVSRAEILPVFGEDIGRNIFFVPLNERRKQLEQIPWVQHATVMRLLPDQIRVSVVERQPVAFVRHGQQIGLVDANGVLLNMPAAMMAQHHYSFPVLTGIDAGDPLPSRKARIDLYLRMLGELDANGQHVSEQISEIDLTDPEDARVLMPEQGTDILAHFGEDHFYDRYQRYKAHIAEWRRQYPKLAAVDLRYDQQVVLQMASGAAADQASISAADAKPAALSNAETPKPDAATKLNANKPAAAAKSTAQIAAPKLIAKRDMPKTTVKPPQKHETARADAPKPAAKTVPKHEAAKVRAPKPAAAKKDKLHASAKTKAPAMTKEERVKALAEKMRKEREARSKRASASKAKQANKSKQKPASKPKTAGASAQGK